MGLFKRRQSAVSAGTAGSDTEQAANLARSALALGLRPADGNPLQPGPADLVERMCWTLYGRRYGPTSGYYGTTISYQTHYRDAYAGYARGRRVVVANAWTNIGPQHVVKLLEMTGVAVCAVEVGSVSPVLLVQRNDLPAALGVRPTRTGDAALDGRFDIVLAPGVGPAHLTADVRRRLLAHDDWGFVGDATSIACLSPGPFRSGEELEHRLDEVLGLLEAFPAEVVPRQVDRSVDDLAARIDQISSLEDALQFLQLSPDDRDRLARSATPLAPFADVSTPEQAMARLQSLDVPQRMQLIAMFERLKGG